MTMFDVSPHVNGNSISSVIGGSHKIVSLNFTPSAKVLLSGSMSFLG